MYYITLHCIISYYIILYCIILYYIVFLLYYIILNIVFCCILLYQRVLYYIILLLFYIILLYYIIISYISWWFLIYISICLHDCSKPCFDPSRSRVPDHKKERLLQQVAGSMQFWPQCTVFVPTPELKGRCYWWKVRKFGYGSETSVPQNAMVCRHFPTNGHNLGDVPFLQTSPYQSVSATNMKILPKFAKIIIATTMDFHGFSIPKDWERMHFSRTLHYFCKFAVAHTWVWPLALALKHPRISMFFPHLLEIQILWMVAKSWMLKQVETL